MMIDVKKFVDEKLKHGVKNTENFSISYATVLSLMEDLHRLLQQTPCTTLCHVVNECGVGHTRVAKVFREQQAAIDYAVEMNGHAERLKQNIEYRLLEVPLA
jgi:hypothetical protein